MSWNFKLYNNPYAEQIALTIAQAQKELKEPKDDQFGSQDSLQMFQDMLVRQLLSKLTSSIVNEAFGDGELDFGDDDFIHYTIGDYDIMVEQLDGALKVTITDLVTGDTTMMEVPYYSALTE